MRPLSEIAREITKDFMEKGNKIPINTLPYLNSMMYLNGIDDMFIHDSGRSIVTYFLANAGSWRGEKAREIKKELNKML
jgi:hypothetical protein